MKKGLIVLVIFLIIGFAGCAGLVGYFVYWAVGEVKEFGKPADEFLALIASGDFEGAYDSGSGSLRAAQSLEEFTAAVKKMGLTSYQSSNWSSMNRVNSEAKLSGTVTLKDGTTIPLTVTMLKENDIWKVTSLSTTPGGATIVGPATTQKIPSDAELTSLARETMVEFYRALKADDFTAFLAKCSQEMREKYKPEDLREAFKPFVQKKIDISFVETMGPDLKGLPTIDPKTGVVEFERAYHTERVELICSLRYVYQNGAWKLLHIKVDTDDFKLR